MSAPKLPAHGTPARYRRELKEHKVCDKCRTAENKRRNARRAAKRAEGLRPKLHLVDSGQNEGPSDESATEPTADPPADPQPGPMENAVQQDIAETASTVPFHHSLETMAIALAREIDAPDSKASKSASTKQLYDVLKSLRGEEGDGGDQGALKTFLDKLNVPLIPEMPTKVRNAPQSK